MQEQKYILKDAKSFEPNHVFDCGQCFRWEKQKDGSYTGIFNNNVLNVNKIDNDIIFKGICENNIKEVCTEYFDLERNYEDIKLELSKVDDNLKRA